MKLDRKDIQLLGILSKDAKATVSELSEELKLPVTTVHNRIKRLEKAKVIQGYQALIDYEYLDKPVVAYVLVSAVHMLPNGMKVALEQVAKYVRDIDGVIEVDSLTGLTDIMAKVRAASVRELNSIVVKKIREIEGVDKTQTMIVLNSF